jgi:hypothetical protein
MKTSVRILSIIALLGVSGCDKLQRIIGKEGYTLLRPPSTLMMPGTIVYRAERGSAIKAGIVCTQEASLGPALQDKLEVSDSATSKFAQKLSGKFSVGAAYLDTIKADAEFSHVKTISLTLSNVKVYELPINVIVDNEKLRSEGCKAALKFAGNKEMKVSMISSALQADVVYSVELDTTASADAALKLKVMQGLAVKLGGKLEVGSESTLSGQGLLWGLRENEDFVDTTRKTGAAARLFDAGAIVEEGQPLEDSTPKEPQPAPAEPAEP